MSTATRIPVLMLIALAVASAAAGDVPVNPTCPVTAGEPVDPAVSTDYQGRQVFFCCPLCRKKFLADPAAYLGNLPPVPPAKEVAHDHAHDHGQGGNRLLRFLGKFHPAVLHFPIALILLAAAAEGFGMLRPRPWLEEARRPLAWTAALAAAVTAALGWAAHESMHVTGEMAEVMERHEWTGISTAALALLAAVLLEVSRRRPGLRWAYRTALLASAVLVMAAGWFGGILVYGPEHYTW